MNYSVDQDPNRTLTFLYVLYIIAILGGLLAIVALIINYVKRRDVQGSIFESHFTWQIRTFGGIWLGILLHLSHFSFCFTGDNANAFCRCRTLKYDILWVSDFAAWVWIVYRAIRGLIALNDNQPMYQ